MKSFLKKIPFKKILTTLSVIFALFLISLKIYLHEYQKVVYAGSTLIEERCLVTDLSDKNTELLNKFRDDLLADDLTYQSEEYIGRVEEIDKRVANEILVSDSWNKKQEAFLTSPKTNFFHTQEIKDRFNTQLSMYKAQTTHHESLRNLVMYPTEVEFGTNLEKAYYHLGAATDEYYKAFEKVHVIPDWRLYLIDIPEVECEESLPSIPQDYEIFGA